MFRSSSWRSAIWSVQKCTWSSPRVKYLPRSSAEATGLSSSRGNVSLCPDPDFTQPPRNHSTYQWWATVPQGVWEVNHQSAIHSPYCNLPKSSLSCNRRTLLRTVLYARQPFLYVWEVSWTVELLKNWVCSRHTSMFICLYLGSLGISFAFPPRTAPLVCCPTSTLITWHSDGHTEKRMLIRDVPPSCLSKTEGPYSLK